jgi:hypothetical protein
MAKYIYLYRGPATPLDSFTPAERDAQMAAWQGWMGGLGSALVDGGAPFGQSTAVLDTGGEEKASEQNGYTIVEAADLETAKRLSQGSPFLSRKSGEFAIDIFELLPM